MSLLKVIQYLLVISISNGLWVYVSLRSLYFMEVTRLDMSGLNP